MSIKRPFLLFSLVCLGADFLMMLTHTDYIILPLFLCATACIVLSLRASVYAKHFLIATGAVVMSALLFSLNLLFPPAYENLSIKNAVVLGEVHEIKPETKNSYAYILKDFTVNEKEYRGYLRLYSTAYSPALPGDRIEFTASEIFSDDSEGLYRYHSLSSKTYLTAFCREEPEITEPASETDIISEIGRLRWAVTRKYFDNMPYEQAAVTTALITGGKDYISDEIALSFRLSGISHIFAVSGMHLSLWTGLFFLIFRQRAKSALIPNIAAILFVIFFCIFTGFSPSVLRSGIMLAAVFAAKLLRRQADSLNSLGIAGSILLLYNPFLAGNVSFLLSFAATFSVIWFSEFIIPQLFSVKRKKLLSPVKIIKRTTENISISVAVILTTLPITAVFFGYVSLLSPIAGLVVTPLAEAVMMTSFLAAVIPTGNVLSLFLFRMTTAFASAITEITAFFGQAEFMILSTKPSFVIPWFIISALIIFTVYLKTKSRRNMLICILTSTAVLICASALHSAAQKDETKIYIPGSNNATNVTVVSDSGRKSIVYGTGGDYETVTKTTAYLNASGTMRTDALIIPRDRKTENGNTAFYTTKVFPKSIIKADTDNSDYSFTLNDKISIFCKTASDFNAAVLTVGEIKVIICSLPCSDFSRADSVFTSADILICRNALPKNLNPDSFKEIIIMTDSPYTKEHATASTYGGDIEITLKGDTYALSR